MPTVPKPRATVACPICGEAVESLEHNAGWIQRTMFGTRVGTYPNLPPADVGPDGGAASLEPLPEMSEIIAGPCGDRVTAEQAERMAAAVRT